MDKEPKLVSGSKQFWERFASKPKQEEKSIWQRLASKLNDDKVKGRQNMLFRFD